MMAERENIMAKMTATALANALRNRYAALLLPALEEAGETVLCVGNGKYAVPCTNDEGDDAWVTLSLSVPKGTRDGDAYDGYEEAAAYNEHVQAVADRKAEAERVKAEKAAERERKKAEKEAAKKAKAEAAQAEAE